MKDNVIAYTPKHYDAYIDALTLVLVQDLKAGKIDEKVFSDTYAKYQKMRVDNCNAYHTLPKEIKAVVDSVSEKLLFKGKEKDEMIQSLQEQVANLTLQNKQLVSRIATLESELAQLRNHSSPLYPVYDPFDPLNPWRIT